MESFEILGVVAVAGKPGESREPAQAVRQGGGIAVVTSLAMIGIMFRGADKADPKRVMTRLYAGEAVKLALTVVLFVAAIRFMRPAIAPLLLAYIATLPVYWLALLRKSRNGMS